MEKVHRVIKSNQKAWLKLYIDMNTELRRDTKSDFENSFLKFMNNQNIMGNVRKLGEIKLITIEAKRNYLVSEPIYHTTKSFTENLLAIEKKKYKHS